MMDTELKINVSIAERNFPITIEAKEEPIYRQAAKELNDTLLSYRKLYQTLEDKERLSMIAYGLLVKLLKKDMDKELEARVAELREVDKELTTIVEEIYN